MAAKTAQAKYALENRLAIMRVGDAVQGAADLINRLSGADVADDISDLLFSRQTLMSHMLVLDGALDRLSSDVLFQKREEGVLAGVALATDESPPSQPRFRGLRFQITVMYVGTFPPLESWESSATPPILCTSVLGGLMHCPGKKGTDVSRILEKQLNRVGLNCWDVVSCTGDGGGENEGSQGVHAHFETLSPGYVRRRCLPHIAWRTADMAIRASGLDYKALAAYFVEGITWTRLREIATRAPADGGLGLFQEPQSKIPRTPPIASCCLRVSGNGQKQTLRSPTSRVDGKTPP